LAGASSKTLDAKRRSERLITRQKKRVGRLHGRSRIPGAKSVVEGKAVAKPVSNQGRMRGLTPA